MADNVYCNGVSLAQWLTPIGLVKMWGLPPGVGQDYQIPGYVGALPAQMGRGPRSVQVGGLIVGMDMTKSPPQPTPYDVEEARDVYHTKLIAFTDAVYQDGDPFTLTWVTGPTGTETTRSALARYNGGIDDINQLEPWAGRVAVDFLLLTPYWQ